MSRSSVGLKFHRYELKGPLFNRKGALIKVEYGDGFGVADLCPFEPWGDLPLEEQIREAKLGHFTPQFQIALDFALLDGEARYHKKPLLTETPDSHVLIAPFQPIPIGFKFVKIKLGRKLDEEMAWLLSLKIHAKFRLDFNEALTETSFRHFLQTIEPLYKQIDFIEDPFEYDEAKWKKIQDDFPIDLAVDREMLKGFQGPAKVLIYKPAREKLPLKRTAQRIVVTSSLDHPLGELAAAYTSLKVTKEAGGFLSHRMLEPTPFSQLVDGKFKLEIPPGYGFGFDDLLQGLTWDDH